MAVIESDLSDIQFLGNWNSTQPSSLSSFVSAIVLTPEGAPSEIPRTFSRTQTSVVHVGRTPAVDSSVATEDRATFSNPVMSRNHAKITFADSGSAFVIDTNSHHGTWVSRSVTEFKLAGESPFQLQDGDRLTFGKEVQRNGILHSPLSVHVKLLHSTSTPSSMSISSSSSVSPASKGTSPRPRNRFGLDSSSDSDASSDNDDSLELDPCTGPNAIRVELPFHRSHGILDSPTSPKSTAVIRLESGSPVCKSHSFSTSQRSSPLQILTPFINSPRFSSGLLSPPGLELERVDVPADAVVEPGSSSHVHQSASPTPPWRRMNERPWRNLSLLERMPDLLQDPPRKLGRLLNPLWMRASMVTGGDERGGRPGLLSRIQSSGDDVNVLPENHDQLHHAFPSNPIHHGPHLHGHGHNYGQNSVRLDANWGLYGQTGAVMNEVKTLNEWLGELKKDVETLKTKEGDRELDIVFSRLDELSSELKDKIAENAKISQQALVAESAELEALKNATAALQNDMSILKAHKSAMQTDIRFLRASYEEIKNIVKDNAEKHTNDMATLSEDTLKTRQVGAVLRGELEELRNRNASYMHDLIPLRTNMSEVNNGIETLQTNMLSANTSLVDINGEIQALKRTHVSVEQELPSRIREQVRNEVRTLMEKGGEFSSIIGKRKRGDDDFVDTPAPGSNLATSMARPRKRMRIVVDCAAAGVLGAVGAWLGLAFL